MLKPTLIVRKRKEFSHEHICKHSHGCRPGDGGVIGHGQSLRLRLAQEGYTVFAGVRKEHGAQALTQQGANRLIPVILDVAKGDTIAAAVQTIRETVGTAGLAGLVNNAGIGVMAPIELVPLDQLRRQFEINVTGQVAVIQACLPLIRQARGRIINVSSVGGRVTIPLADRCVPPSTRWSRSLMRCAWSYGPGASTWYWWNRGPYARRPRTSSARIVR